MCAQNATRKRKNEAFFHLEEHSEDELLANGLDDALSFDDDECDNDEDKDSEDSSFEDRNDASVGIDGELSDDTEKSKIDEEKGNKEGDERVTAAVDGYQDDQNYRIEKAADGGERYVYPEIDADYDSDDTDVQGPVNTIGNISFSYYDEYPHIGYDINGQKIMRPATKAALDHLLDTIEVPEGWTGLIDKNSGEALNLSREELELVRRVHTGLAPEEGYDPYPDTIEWFTSVEEKMPLSAAPEPKRRFLPSKHEQTRVMKLVRAIREGRILPYNPNKDKEEEEEKPMYDLWRDEEPRKYVTPQLAMPKLPPPGNDQSYHPPPEYLPTKEEKKAWEETDPEEREKDYQPTSYSALRQVPAWPDFVKHRFERCLDMYLAPRVKKNRLNIDPMSLLPKLPQPKELKPFPTLCQTTFRGHTGAVRSVAIDPSGCFLATGGSDSTLRVWDLLTGRCLWSVGLGEGAVSSVRWRPTKETFICAATIGEEVFLAVPPFLVSPELEKASRDVLDAGFGHHAQQTPAKIGTVSAGKWQKPEARLLDEGVHLKVTVRSSLTTVSWHRKGDHFVTVSPRGARSSVAVHTLSKHLTQIPFRRLAGLAQAAHFHPLRPFLFVATQQSIRCYDLQKLELIKLLQPGAKWLSQFDIHTSGDHVIAGSYDRRLLWHDLDLSSKPFKTMRFHEKAVRSVRFHRGEHPLFCDASDDGTLQVFHGRVPADSMDNPTIVPLKVLRGHAVMNSLGVMDTDWHPREPWVVSGGADGTARLWM